MTKFDYDDTWDQDDDQEEQDDEPIRFADRVTSCPACGKPITDEMDSCPYCGDILFRYLKDGTFSPRKGPLVKVVSAIIILLVVLATLGLLLRMIF